MDGEIGRGKGHVPLNQGVPEDYAVLVAKPIVGETKQAVACTDDPEEVLGVEGGFEVGVLFEEEGVIVGGGVSEVGGDEVGAGDEGAPWF